MVSENLRIQILARSLALGFQHLDKLGSFGKCSSEIKITYLSPMTRLQKDKTKTLYYYRRLEVYFPLFNSWHLHWNMSNASWHDTYLDILVDLQRKACKHQNVEFWTHHRTEIVQAWSFPGHPKPRDCSGMHIN